VVSPSRANKISQNIDGQKDPDIALLELT